MNIALSDILAHSRDTRPTSAIDYGARVTDALAPTMATDDISNLGEVTSRVGLNIVGKKATNGARYLRRRTDALTNERRYLRSRLNAGDIDQAMYDTMHACLTQCIDLMTLRRSALTLAGREYDAANPTD